jgi:serine protease AprX
MRLEQHAPLLAALGMQFQPLVAANAFRVEGAPEQIRELIQADQKLDLVELDPLVQVTSMDDVVGDIELGDFRLRHPTLDGTGVTVAVLDSGIDTHHPCLVVADSVSTCGEPVELPGEHGTHCAGSIASRDPVFSGVAPGVTLLNIKVLNANGSGRNTFISAGVDAALDRGAQVLSMSIGFNHLPTWSDGGHGWACPDGRCPLCTAVDNAVRLEDVVCVVAAGNEHQRAEALRSIDPLPFDTELGCPGQAEAAITVGAITKQTREAAPFSSHGPSSFGGAKPDLVAPGVNITSTIPLPRDEFGQPQPASRARQFGRMSGTSMATPIVAGAVALVIQDLTTQGKAWKPDQVRQTLLEEAVAAIDGQAGIFGHGRLSLAQL